MYIMSASLQRAHNPEVVGSNPAPATKIFEVSCLGGWPFFLLWQPVLGLVADLWQSRDPVVRFARWRLQFQITCIGRHFDGWHFIHIDKS